MGAILAAALPYIGPAVSAAGSFLGSSSQSGDQRAAADKAASTSRLGFDYLASSPVGTNYLPSGAAANNSIAALLGVPQGVPVGGAPAQAGPTETPGMLAARAATGTRGGGGNAGISIGGIDPLNLFSGRKNNSPIQDISQAIALGRTITDAQWAQAGYGPGGSAPGGGGYQQPSPAAAAPQVSQPSAEDAFHNYLTSTGYQFRLNEGDRNLTASAGTKGLRGSGATGKAFIDYGQNTASTEFNNYLAQLGNLATRGLSAGSTIGAAGSSAGATGANAIAQGYGNAAQTQGEGIAGLGGSLGSALNYFLTPTKKAA